MIWKFSSATFVIMTFRNISLVYNYTIVAVKFLLMFLYSNPIYLEMLLIIAVIPVIILLQLWIINIIHKQNIIFNKNKNENLSFKKRFFKLFLLNIWLIIYCMSLYMIFHSNFFTSNFFFIFCIILPIYIIIFYNLFYRKFINNKWKLFKFLLLFLLLIFLTRNLAIIIFSLVLDQNNIILESLKFNPISYIFPIFIADIFSFNLINNFFFKKIMSLFLPFSFKNDTIQTILDEEGLLDCEELKDALKKAKILHFELNDLQKQIFIAFCNMNTVERYTVEAHGAGLTKHLLMRAPHITSPNGRDIAIDPFNRIYENTNPKLSVFTWSGDIKVSDNHPIILKPTNTQAFIEDQINQAMQKDHWEEPFDNQTMVVVGTPKTKDGQEGVYFEEIKIYKKINLSSLNRWDYLTLSTKNELIYCKGSEYAYRLGDPGEVEFKLDGKRHIIPNWKHKKWLNTYVSGKLYKYIAGNPDHLCTYNI